MWHDDDADDDDDDEDMFDANGSEMMMQMMMAMTAIVATMMTLESYHDMTMNIQMTISWLRYQHDMMAMNIFVTNDRMMKHDDDNMMIS